MFVELDCQSHFSFYNGASSPEELLIRANYLGYQAIAITDECSVAGVVRAYRAIKEHDLTVKLIVGSRFVLNNELTITLLCPNKSAYKELCRVISKARRRSEKGQYQLEAWDILSLKACFILWHPSQTNADEIWGAQLARYHPNRVWLVARRYLDGSDDCYLAGIHTLSQRFQFAICACSNVLMHCNERLPLHHTLTAIKHNQAISNIKGLLISNSERALRSPTKLMRLFNPKWLAESVSIAQLCQFELSELSYQYPSELVPTGYNANSYLRYLVEKGQKQRFPEGCPSSIKAIIDKELRLIEELNYPYFFLTIYDIVQFAKQQGILYQGRGSAANSIVCYCLEITAVDPRQIAVLFERFISKERNEPPDIDVDFEHERREEIIQYIYQKYGRERAALAATVICYRFKSAFRDAAKALGLPLTTTEYLLKHIHRRDKKLSWQQQLLQLGLDSTAYTTQHLIMLIEQLLGIPKHLSQHVGGFVISAGPLYELVPVENAAMNDRTVIQWDKDDLETLSLLKVDILALGMLSAIRKCFQSIYQHQQRQLGIADITKLQDDKHVYRMLQQADTVGVFQIESRAQMSMLPRLKPACYYDLVIQIAIVRPGPIQGDMVHPFLKRRAGVEQVTYPSSEVKEVLARTLGVPIFQEQVIKLAMIAAGFSGGEADQLRRAMAAWKKHGDVHKFKDKLINGMLKRGYQLGFAEQLFAQICGFGEYGFPESHSASFAVLAYVSAWLKYYYPAHFYCAILNSQPMGFYSPSQLIQDAKRHGITILPICVQYSHYHHQVLDESTIRLGFRLVKGLSSKSAKLIEQHNKEALFDSIHQVKQLGINQKDIAALASANAFQYFANNRYHARWQLMDNLPNLPLFTHYASNEHIPLNSPTQFDNVIEDYQSTGLSLTQHPIALLCQYGVLGHHIKADQLPNIRHKSMVTVVGMVTGKQSPGTAAGVTFVTLEDDTGNINLVVWAGTANAQRKAYLTAKILKVKGILEREGDVIHVIAGKLTDLTHHLSELSYNAREFK